MTIRQAHSTRRTDRERDLTYDGAPSRTGRHDVIHQKACATQSMGLPDRPLGSPVLAGSTSRARLNMHACPARAPQRTAGQDRRSDVSPISDRGY